ncbi:MAG: TonB-dependent receptor [Caulobacterales bacterium]
MAGRNQKKFWLFTASAVATLLATDYAAAQDSADGEIVVTATRRETRLQDVPIAVTPVTAEMIQNSGIRDLQDLTSVAPGLVFTNAAAETSATARLRGVGTEGSNPGLESAVGIFVDGVYRARNGVALTDIGEISQVEVLRGPQGTLFGRNTSAGLITVRTAGPDLSEYSGHADLTVGNYSELRVSGGLSGPIIEDVLGFRLFAASAGRDGYLDVISPTGFVRDANTRNVQTIRGQLLWEPNSDVSLRLIADYTQRDEECCAAEIYNPALLNSTPFTNAGAPTVYPPPTASLVGSMGGFGPGGVATLGNGTISNRTGFSNRSYDQEIEDSGFSGELNWEIGDMTLTAISAYRDWSVVQGQDADFTGADITFRDKNTGDGFGFEIFTQEFRLTGVNGPLDWLVGLYYADETLTRNDNFTMGANYRQHIAGLLTPTLGSATAGALTAGLLGAQGRGIRDTYEQSNSSLALFTHNIFSITDATELTVGLRYTQEEKDFNANYVTQFSGNALRASTTTTLTPLAGAATAASVATTIYGLPWLNSSLDGNLRRSREENEWSGIVSLRHEFSDIVSAYVSYSQGYKAGGYNLDRDYDTDPSFAAETVDAYELGVKTRLMNGDLILNTAAYYQEFANFQLNTFTGIQFIVASIPEVISQGVEVDAMWRTPIEGLSFQGGVAYTEAEYGSFTAGPGISARLPNARLTNSPLWTTTGAWTFERPMFNGALNGLAYIDARYTSNVVSGSDLAPAKRQPEYTLVNGRLGLSTPDESWGIELWARNLTDEEYTVINFDLPLQAGSFGSFLGDPRTYGVTLRARY